MERTLEFWKEVKSLLQEIDKLPTTETPQMMWFELWRVVNHEIEVAGKTAYIENMKKRIPEEISVTVQDKHKDFIDQLQEEVEGNRNYHYNTVYRSGIRSTQISALVMLLVRKGILK